MAILGVRKRLCLEVIKSTWPAMVVCIGSYCTRVGLVAGLFRNPDPLNLGIRTSDWTLSEGKETLTLSLVSRSRCFARAQAKPKTAAHIWAREAQHRLNRSAPKEKPHRNKSTEHSQHAPSSHGHESRLRYVRRFLCCHMPCFTRQILCSFRRVTFS